MEFTALESFFQIKIWIFSETLRKKVIIPSLSKHFHIMCIDFKMFLVYVTHYLRKFKLLRENEMLLAFSNGLKSKSTSSSFYQFLKTFYCAFINLCVRHFGHLIPNLTWRQPTYTFTLSELGQSVNINS